MRRLITAYIGTLIPLLVLDFIWLSLSGGPIYQAHLGGLMSLQPDLAIAALFYLMYAVGLIKFVVLPAIKQHQWRHALGFGALFGFVAYGTYDLTNQATLIGWSSFVTMVDMAWGTFGGACACTIGYFITRKLNR